MLIFLQNRDDMTYADVAQMAEQMAFNYLVRGSIPLISTTALIPHDVPTLYFLFFSFFPVTMRDRNTLK